LVVENANINGQKKDREQEHRQKIFNKNVKLVRTLGGGGGGGGTEKKTKKLAKKAEK